MGEQERSRIFPKTQVGACPRRDNAADSEKHMLGWRNTFEILPELEGDSALTHDASTNALIDYFRSNK